MSGLERWYTRGGRLEPVLLAKNGKSRYAPVSALNSYILTSMQCDQQIPSCKRCIRLFGQCPGYPDPWLLTLRRQDARAAEMVCTRVEKSRRRRTEQGGVIDIPLVRTLDISAETASVHKFYADYITESGATFLELIGNEHASRSTQCLSAALGATAMASSSRQLCQSGLMSRAREAYGKAVREIRLAIRDNTLTDQDSVLISMFVLGLFQTVAAEFAPQQSPKTEPGCHPHARGALALLRYRAEHQLLNSVDRKLLALFRQIRLMDLFTTSRNIPLLWFELDAFVNSLEHVPNIEPLIRRAVDYKVLFLSIDLGMSAPEIGRIQGIQVPELIWSGLSLAQDLDEAAAEIVYVDGVGIPSASFNGFITISSATNAAIASELDETDKINTIMMVQQILVLFAISAAAADMEFLADTGRYGPSSEVIHAFYNQYPTAGANYPDRLIDVQSVVIDSLDRLWIPDTGRALTKEGLLVQSSCGGPKIVGVNLTTNEVFQTILFPRHVAYPDSYIDDLRLDFRPELTEMGKRVAYITDTSPAGHSGIIIVDLGTGER
ncbi:hypothetical protein KAF25_000211 [Fusarium avenaceum]|uniref:Uncharacterized protein n=1 Tax=Fusarium avenaceum TaxID=40199 RepID=A0A9P7GRU2_9HYPO|nr:hypothetical protein KAF25_000211 [Fusarium avenaceum]